MKQDALKCLFYLLCFIYIYMLKVRDEVRNNLYR